MTGLPAAGRTRPLPAGGARLARGLVLALALIGSAGCSALPQLPGTAADDDGLAGVVVAHAASSFCAGAYAWLKSEPTRDVRLADAHRIATRGGSDGAGGLVLRDLRDLPLPHDKTNAVTVVGDDAADFVDDPRSGLADIPQIVEATVVAADLAYDIREREGSDAESGELDLQAVARELPGYRIQKIYADRFSGLKAVVFESLHSRHRIYGIAGTQVFIDRDYRDWASGMLMARPQFVSDAGLLLAQDAADYARDPDGGEVFFTGQSQGAVIAQALGYLTQELLDATPQPHRPPDHLVPDHLVPDHLLHVVTWGVTGASEALAEMIDGARRGEGRGVSPALEAHWRQSGAGNPDARRIWDTLAGQWTASADEPAADRVRRVAQQMHVIGYFFDIDPFARVGTFLGTPLVFPVELVLPQRCEPLVTELVLNSRIGSLGLQLESHFLKGYRRAVGRGAAELARPARIEQRRWVLDLLPVAEVIGHTWLDNIYLTQLGGDEANWQRCFASGHWITDRNRDCRHRYWPGCDRQADASDRSPPAADAASWCLIDRPAERASDVSTASPAAPN